MTKQEHRSVSGLFTRRGVALHWEKIDVRPADQRERELQALQTEASRLLDLLIAQVLAQS
jgi:hypothetical protein